MAVFAVESEGYQAFMQLKGCMVTDDYTILQGSLLKKTGNTLNTVDVFNSGLDSTDDSVTGTLIGSLVGILGGPLGILLGGMTGNLIGSAKDAGDVEDNQTLLETVGEKLLDGEVAIVLLAQEQTPENLDGIFGRFDTTVIRRDAADVEDEVEEAERLEKEMAEEARRKLHEEKSAERRQKMESNRAKLKESFENFKEKIFE